MIEKAAASAADAVCLDLEDSVAPAEKSAARGHAARALRAIDFGARIRLLRVNAIDTPWTYRDLVDVVEEAGDRLDALIFGAGDYAASMRMPSAAIGERDAHDAADPGDRWHAVMHTIVAAARANGLRCMDGPYAGYRDAAGLERACGIARAMGFDGKQCIHPAQVAVVNAAFTPSAEDVARAVAVVEAYEAAVAAGSGVAVHEGRMIDAASLRMARTILERGDIGLPR
jgi:citrate lyase beta subunit